MRKSSFGTALCAGVSLPLIASAALAQSAPSADPPKAPATPAAVPYNPLGDIVVTARRRAENIQTVPVSVTAFNSDTLRTRNIVTSSDLQKVVPGVIFVGAGSDLAVTYSIRGQSRDVIGPGLPSVISYFNEVPLPVYGSALPTYDVSSVQVLKGPQGTLFGRNTTGGAVLLYSAPVTDRLEGYAQATLGDYFWNALEGAINVPIADGVGLRVAGQYQKREGYERDLGGGAAQANLNSRALRATLKLQPTDWLTNVTVGDYYWSHTNGDGYVGVGTTTANPIYRFIPGFNCGTSTDCDVDLELAAQKARGFRTIDSNLGDYTHAKIWGVSNTTTLNLGPITVKNIFGYRETNVDFLVNTDGLKFALLDAHTQRFDKQLTDELQFSGALFDDRVNWLVGGFYFDAKPNGPESVALDIFDAARSPDTDPFSYNGNSMYLDRSKAVFGNVSVKLFEGLKLNGGLRETWDREGTCAANLIPYSTPSFNSIGECRASPGSYSGSAKSNALTYTVGADYQITRDLFTYVTARRGYRAGGLNTPKLGGLLTPFQSYGPQYINDVEIGAKTEWKVGDIRGRFNVAVFRGIFKDLQRQITALAPNLDGDNDPNDEPSNTSLVINGGKARIQGVEIDGLVQPTPRLTFNYGVSYIDAKILKLTAPPIFAGNSGATDTYPMTPKWSYNASARYELPFTLSGAKFVLNADYYHINHYLSGVFTVPGYGIADANIELDNIGGTPLSATVFVTNLANKLYLQNSNLNGISPGVAAFSIGAPRMFGVRLRYAFGH